MGVIRSQATFREKCLGIWSVILGFETLAGTRWLLTKPDGLPYVVLGATGEIAHLSRRGSDAIYAYLSAHYGLGEREEVTRFAYDAMRAHAQVHGVRVELRRFAAYSEATKTVYLNAYNGSMWRITGDGCPALVPNGEDNVFFLADDGGVAVEGMTSADIGPHNVLFDALTNLNFTNGIGGVTPSQQRQAIIVWLFCLALPDLMPTKPLLLVEGTQGAGKSTGVQMIQLALMGATKPMILTKSKEDSFGILLLRSPIAMFDNTDSYIDWVADQICAYTTTGIFPRRKLYSDDEEVIIRPHAFVAVASKNPVSFRREDVTDRSIIIRLERRDGFRPLKVLEAEIKGQRVKIIGEYIHYLDQIVAAIRAGALEEGQAETHRMADFSAVARVVGNLLGWGEQAVPEMMQALQNERDAFANEEDPLIELIHTWIAYRPRMGPSNIGREIDINTLFAELETLAQAQGIERSFYKSPRVLAQKIRSPHILRDFDIEILQGSGKKSYKLRRKTDPKLEVIEGGIFGEMIDD